MRYESDRDNFASIMIVTWQSYGRNKPERETMRFWFDKLINNEFDVVANAFDEWIKSQKDLPTVNDIVRLCKPKDDVQKALPRPNDHQRNKLNAEKLSKQIAVAFSGTKDKRDWARRIIAKPSDYPAISLKFAQEALNEKKATSKSGE